MKGFTALRKESHRLKIIYYKQDRVYMIKWNSLGSGRNRDIGKGDI
jgi:hypothetical protein